MKRIVIDPVTRIEGHLKIEVLLDNGKVKECDSSGTLFRGFEIFLKGRDPRDAQRITQRVCGVCPASHATASTLNLDSAFGIADKIPDNGRIIRNLILGANFIQSHILHFYHLAALDYVDVTSVAEYNGNEPDLMRVKDFIARGELAPFLPRYEGDYRLDTETNIAATAHYVEALRVRRLAHELLAIFGGKMPHNMGVMPGGVTNPPTTDKITNFLWRLNRCRDFIDNYYIPDVVAVAKAYPDYFSIGKGCDTFVAYGVFDMETGETDLAKRERFLPSGVATTELAQENFDPTNIIEHIKHSWFAGETRPPASGITEPLVNKEGAYSWIKSPRYQDRVAEVGPLARILNAYLAGHPAVKSAVDTLLSELHSDIPALFSTLGRHAARALETKLVADAMAKWVLQLEPGEPICIDYELPAEAEGMGLTEAPRGALGHWIRIKDGVIEHYQLVVPTSWNASPKDDNDNPGPIEQAVMGTEVRDAENPFEIVRIVRSFDPCLACAVHLIDYNGRKLGEYKVV